MSAFVVSDITITKILSAIYCDHATHPAASDYFLEKHNVKRGSLSEVEALGRKLLGMNQAAVNHRYNDDEAMPHYEFTPIWPCSTNRKALLVGAYKAIRCLIYQCSEGDVPEWDLFKFLEELGTRLAMGIVNELPEYDAADWG